jgi:hypothetical protein
MKQPLPGYIRAGVTGFYYYRSTPPPVTADLKEFRALCYTAARVTDATILGFDPSPFKTIRNFVFALLQFSKTSGAPSVFLLLNQYAPLLAFACAHDQTLHLPDGPPFTFMDIPELIATFEHSYYVLKKEELELPWIWSKPELASSLSPVEIEQIKFWKPQTVGEVLFNVWD